MNSKVVLGFRILDEGTKAANLETSQACLGARSAETAGEQATKMGLESRPIPVPPPFRWAACDSRCLLVGCGDVR